MKRKILAGLLSLCMMVSLVPTTVFAADTDLPNATVKELGKGTLTAEKDGYICWPSGDNTIERPLDIVVNFKANETLEQAQAGKYAKWIVDFYLTFTGFAGDTLMADNSYLAGNYGEFGWIVIPTDGLEITKGTEYPVVAAYDAKLTYENICDYVKDFTAAIHIDDAIFEANPDLQVTLALKMKNPTDESDVLEVGKFTYGAEAFGKNTVDDLEHKVEVEVPEIKEEVETTQTTVSDSSMEKLEKMGDDIVEAIESGDEEKIAKAIDELCAEIDPEEASEVADAIKEALDNKEELTVTFAVEREEIDENVVATDPDIAAIKAKIAEEGLVADETVLEITVTKTISTPTVDEVAKVELKDLGEGNEIEHTVKFPTNLPDVVEGMQRIWTMYSYHEGIVETYPVTDLGNGYGTFASSKYSYYVLGYEVVEIQEEESTEETPAPEHNWSDDFKTDSENHWRYCKDCGKKKTKHPHIDVNKDNHCDACDYVMTGVSTGRQNPNTGVTADMLK